jgi:radical SAM protein with 4Fe4S-binding SPASM domain
MSTGKKINLDEVIKELESANNQKDPKCKNCPILDVCQTCYGLNYVHNGSPFLRNDDECKFQKLRAKGTAYLWAGMITNRERNYAYLASKDDTDFHYMIKAVELIDDRIRL